jgi:hypothetical protein
MGNRNNIRIVLGSLRYKSAPNTNLSLKVPFKQNVKEIIEYDRTKTVNLLQVYDNERQQSTKFRPTGKFSIVFQNSYTGRTNYEPFENNLYYVNEDVAAANQCGATNNANSIFWSGFPQYSEFDFIRTDNNVIGYTKFDPTGQNTNLHVNFVNKSASTYNWMYYMSYGYENNFIKRLSYYDIKYNTPRNWVVGEGLPIVCDTSSTNGLPIISFRSPLKHGLNVGEFVRLSTGFTYNSGSTYQVYSLGDGFFGSEEYVFNIVNPGFTGNTFVNGKFGLARRFILEDFETESSSKYYVRTNKILTDLNDSVLVKAGFEQSIFGTKKKYESSGYTPDKQARISVKEGSQSYTLTFDEDIDISGIIDNQKKPITELFFTIIWRGYFGWFLSDTTADRKKIKNGYEFNLPLLPNGEPSDWWRDSNSLSEISTLTYDYYQTTSGSLGSFSPPRDLRFYYTNPLSIGDVIEGDICEWNDYTQEERVISSNYHKIKFNPNNFYISATQSQNPLGYYYKPHYPITLRVYSDYIEEAETINIGNIPSYSYYSTSREVFIWRDLYTYGFVDSSGLGVDYPFLNGKHYPYESYFFRIIPEGTNYNLQTVINEPIIDNCE